MVIMIKIYYSPSCSSCRKVKKWFEEQNIPYEGKDIFASPLSREELKDIITKCIDGTDDIISPRSKIVSEQNIDFDSMKISELISFIQEHPSILRRPIIVDDRRVQVGYNEEEIRTFIPRARRLAEMYCNSGECPTFGTCDASCDRLEGKKVLLRAHGEPPSTYETARRNHITIVDATCPVVLQLQKKIHRCFVETREKGTQIVIYGKKGHAEVNGLVGQTEGEAIVIESVDDVDKLDFNRPIALFSQTTKSLDGFRRVVEAIKARISEDVDFQYYDTICRQVANRLPNIQKFASAHDYVYFVAGRKSSNGKMLFEECRKANPNSLFISDAKEITEPLPEGVRKVGVCGATSTPKWLMEEVAEKVKRLNAE